MDAAKDGDRKSRQMLRVDTERARRIVITGLGIVCPLGQTPEDVWEALDHPPQVQPTGAALFRGKIDEFGELRPDVRKRLRKSLKLMNRETQLGVAAGQQAIRSSGWSSFDPQRFGVCFGADNVSVMPGDFASAVRACSDDAGELQMDRWGEEGLLEVAPLWLLKCLPNMPACHLAIINDLQGPNNTLTQRDVAFGLALAEACRNIRSGVADAMLVGATGTTRNTFNLMHARLEREVANDAAERNAGQFVDSSRHPMPAEGAAALLIEDYDIARRRGAKIWGEILGYASAAFLGDDGAESCGLALSRAIQQTLHFAQLSKESIGHVHTCGLGSDNLNRAERLALEEIFGSSCRSLPKVSTKRRLGHTGAAAGAIEVITSLLSLNQGRLVSGSVDEPSSRGAANEDTRTVDQPAGRSFLSLSLFGRGLGNCIAIGALHKPEAQEEKAECSAVPS